MPQHTRHSLLPSSSFHRLLAFLRPVMSSQSYQYVLAATAELQRSYTKDSDGNPDIESPPCRPLRYNRASHASSSAPSVFSFSSHSRSQSASHTPPANSTPRAFSWSWLVSLMLTAMLSSAVTAAAVLLWTGGDVRLVSQLSSLPLTPSFATGDPLHSAHLLAAARSDSERTLLSVPPAASSFPPSHIPSVATSVPASSLVSDASIAALRGMVAAGRLVDDKQADGNLLIVGVVNFGYIDFALNWLCFVRRHAIHNYLLVAVDDRSVMHLTMLGYGEHVVHVQQLFPEDVLFKECGGVNTHSYRTTCFNRQTELKSLMVLTALMAGYNVVLSDMDIAFIHNPLHYMPLSHYWEMQLEPHEWCTGLYFVQCNPFTVQMETAITLGVRRNNDKDDQEVFNKWHVKHSHTLSHTLTLVIEQPACVHLASIDSPLTAFFLVCGLCTGSRITASTCLTC